MDLIPKDLDTLSYLFRHTLTHMKCIEMRIENSKCSMTLHKKNVLNKAMIKIKTAINDIMSLIPKDKITPELVNEVNDLEKTAYVMVFVEQLMRLPTEDLDQLADIVENYAINKYGT